MVDKTVFDHAGVEVTIPDPQKPEAEMVYAGNVYHLNGGERSPEDFRLYAEGVAENLRKHLQMKVDAKRQLETAKQEMADVEANFELMQKRWADPSI